jgi:hypothetical protein
MIKLNDKLKLLMPFRFKIKTSLLKDDGGKKIVNLKRVLIFTAPILILLVLTTFISSTREDSSFLGRTDKKLTKNDDKKDTTTLNGKTFTPQVSKVLGSSAVTAQKSKASQNPRMNLKINFKAQQVITRDNTGDPTKSIPMGTNMIGKTLTAIDTRESSQIIKILLPYGGRSKLGVEIEKGTILFGHLSYSGRGRKVSITINKGLTPDEREFDIEAHVLDPSNYSVGLVGEVNGQSDVRVLSAMGLSVSSGAMDIMMERETMNGLGQTAPRATLGNATLKGLSESARDESTRQTEKFKDSEDFITIPAGSDVIVSLTKSYLEK